MRFSLPNSYANRNQFKDGSRALDKKVKGEAAEMPLNDFP